jgi:hypothetical protein
MPAYLDTSQFRTVAFPRGDTVTLLQWKWVCADYSSDRKFVIIMEGSMYHGLEITAEAMADFRRADMSCTSFSSATPMLIIEEVW